MSAIPPVPAAKSGLHPVIWIAAIAVILFSVVGIAAMTGLLPGKSAAPEAPAKEASASPEAVPATPAPVAVATPAPAPSAPASQPVEKKVAKPVVKQASTTSSKPANSSDDQRVTYSSKPAPPPPCPDCAVISSIEPVAVEGEGSGLGAIAGGVLGAVIGNQIGGGSGRDVARIAGIAGGAYAGHQIEKSQRAGTAYDIVVRFVEDGSTQRFRENAAPVWQVGDKVRVENGRLVPR